MSRKSLHTLIALLFVLSGAIGLVYQIVWFKYLALFLGNTTYAQTIVLATFMGGLAIGSALWGRRADRAGSPLRLYAVLELAIGVYCLLYPVLIVVVQNAFILVARELGLAPGSSTTLILKLLVSVAMLLPPTILMGGTLPILVRFISRRLNESGRNVALLYFLNSLGAVLGSAFAGFFLIRMIGLRATILSAAVFSLVIGFIALVASMLRTTATVEERLDESSEEEHAFTRTEVVAAIAVAGISGMAAMIYEVTWVRLLIPVLGSSTYSFSLMLVGFISGITLGSLIVSSAVRSSRGLVRMLAFCQLAIAAAMLITVPLYARIPYAFWKTSTVLAHTDYAYPVFLSFQFLFVLLIMIVPTIFLGMSLPLATRIAVRGIDVLGRSVGNVFAVNTLGTVVGSLGAGLVLIPSIGVRQTIETGIFLNLLAGSIFIWIGREINTRQKIAISAVGGMTLVLSLFFLPDWGTGSMLAGVFRQVNSRIEPPKTYAAFSEAVGQTEVLYYREGSTATVGVVQGQTSAGPQNILIINGKADASSRGDLATQVTLAQLPLLLHPQPERVLIVGLGSGITLGSALRHPLDRVDCIEISPEVVEASSYFDGVSGAPLRDPRTALHVEDALAFLKLTDHRYDVIISEPSNPWIAGIGNLFTTEFFEACKVRMRPDGLMVQWFHLYEMNDELFRMVLRTYKQSFPCMTVWQSLGNDVVLLGSAHPVEPNDERIAAALNDPNIRDDLARIGITDIADLLSLHMLSDSAVTAYAGVGEFNTEDHPRLEYEAPRAFFTNVGVASVFRVDERLVISAPGSLLRSRWREGKVSDDDQRRIGMLHTLPSRGNLLFGYSILRSYVERHPGDTEVLGRIAETADMLKQADDEIEYLRRLVAASPKDPVSLERLTWARYLHARARSNTMTGIRLADFEQPLRACIALAKDTVDRYRARLADVLFDVGDFARASDQYARALQIRSLHQPDPALAPDRLLLQLARCLHHLGKTDRALGYALQATQANPENEEAKDFIYDIWSGGMNRQQ